VIDSRFAFHASPKRDWSSGGQEVSIPVVPKRHVLHAPTQAEHPVAGRTLHNVRIQRVDVEAFRERTKGKRGELRRICQPVGHSRANPEALVWRDSGDGGPREAAGDDDWIMAPEAARLLGVQLHTVHHMIERGELAAEVTYPTARPRTRRRIRIRRQEVNDCIERSRVKPGALRHLHPQPSDRYG
jgi:excisionase family DNA binding protein